MQKISKAIMLAFIVLNPATIFAADLHFKVVPNAVSGDTATIVEVSVDPHGKSINVVDGTISFTNENGGALYVNPDTTGSVLTLWPTTPQFSSADMQMHFVGGVPNGFNAQGMLFRMRISSHNGGTVRVEWLDGSAYVNDGKGTEEKISAEPLSVSVGSTGSSRNNLFSMNNLLKSGIIIFILAVIFFVLRYGKKKTI